MSESKVSVSGSGVLVLFGIVAAIVLLAWLFPKFKAVLNAVNPLNQENVFNSGFNTLTGAVGLTAKDETLGTKLAGKVIEFKKWLSPKMSPAEEAAQVLSLRESKLHHCRLALKESYKTYGPGNNSGVVTSLCRDLLRESGDISS